MEQQQDIEESKEYKGRTMKIKTIATLLTVLTLSLLGGGCDQNLRGSSNSGQKYLNPLQTEAFRIVDEALQSSDPLIRTHAIEIVSNSKQMGLMPKVTKLLNDDYVPVRSAAALAIGDTGYQGAIYKLKQHKKDIDYNVRVACAYALTKLGAENLENVILAGVKSDDQTVKANSCLALGKLGKPEYAELLHKVLQDEKAADKVKIQAVESLAMLKDPSVYQKAWALMISKRADDRVMGIKTMQKLNQRESLKAINTMINDDIVEVRLAAAEALTAARNPVGEEILIQYFDEIAPKLDKNTRKRADVHATMALGWARSPELQKRLPKLIRSESPILRLYAAQAVLKNSPKIQSPNVINAD